MGEIIPFTKPAKEERKCSFCNTPESQCTRLVSNSQEGAHQRNICNVCITHAKKRKDEE